MNRDININDNIKTIAEIKIPCQTEGCKHIFTIKTQELTKKSKMVCNCPICNSETEINGEGCYDNILQEFKKYGFYI